MDPTKGDGHRGKNYGRPPDRGDGLRINKLPQESSEESEPVADEEELPSSEEVEIDEADMPFPFRAREKGKLHLQHFICVTGVVPYCRDTPFAAMLQEDAQLLQTPGQWSEICQRCIHGLPETIARKLKRSCDF